MSLPFRLEKDLKSEAKHYTYKELCYLVAWGLVPVNIRDEITPDEYIETYPDVWEGKLVAADSLISHTPFKALDFI
jgi:hypothetical protein